MSPNDWEYVVKPQIQEMDNLFNVFTPGENEDIDELRIEQRVYLDPTFRFDSVKHRKVVLAYILLTLMSEYVDSRMNKDK